VNAALKLNKEVKELMSKEIPSEKIRDIDEWGVF
jgi:hypothetical protein